MPIYIKNRETEALARRLSDIKAQGLTEVIHQALEREMACQPTKPSLVERSREFTKRLHAKAEMSKGFPADKDFIDWLYE